VDIIWKIFAALDLPPFVEPTFLYPFHKSHHKLSLWLPVALPGKPYCAKNDVKVEKNSTKPHL